MKNLVFFATLLIFILNFSNNVISGEANDEVPDPVRDTDGNKLKTGTSYYIAPTFRPGAGVTIYPVANKTWTFRVAQLVLFGDGLPVVFSNAGGASYSGEVVRESIDIMISFDPRMFLLPIVWKVDEYGEAAKQYFVTAGEIDGNETSINKWFQIRKAPSVEGYRFVFCPKVCEYCEKICTNVGIYNDGGLRLFALDGNFPSGWKFKKFKPRTIWKLED